MSSNFLIKYMNKHEMLDYMRGLSDNEYNLLINNIKYLSYEYVKNVDEPYFLFISNKYNVIISMMQFNMKSNNWYLNQILNNISKKTIEIAFISTNPQYQNQWYSKILLDYFFKNYSKDYFFESSYFSDDWKKYLKQNYEKFCKKYNTFIYVSSLYCLEYDINNIINNKIIHKIK